MSPTTKTPKASLQLVKPTEVEIQDGHNPRGSIDEKGEPFKSLVSSIKDLGVLQPLLVSPRTNGHWPLVDGERRLRAARKAKVSEIPVYAVASKDEFFAAIVANMEREDLTPMEEASAIGRMHKPPEGKGLTQPQIAKRLGRSERWVRGRLDLLKLPDSIYSAIDAGTIPLEGAQKLAQIAKASPALAGEIAKEVEKGQRGVGMLMNEWQTAQIANQVAKKAGLFAINDGYGGNAIAQLPIDSKAKKELVEQAKPLSQHDRTVSLGESSDIAALKKQDLLVEIPSYSGSKARFVPIEEGREWIEKTARRRLEKKLKDRAKPKQAAGPNPQLIDEEAEKRKKEQQREAEKAAAARLAHHEQNLALGAGLAKVTRPKLTADAARLFVVLALGVEDLWPAGVAERLALTRGDRHQVKELKRGVDVQVDGAAAMASLVEDLNNAQTADAVFGVALQALMAAHFADIDVGSGTIEYARIPSEIEYEVGSEDNGYRYESLGHPAALLEQIALQAGVLPDSLRKGVEEEQKARAEREAAAAAEREREELGCEIRALMELDRLAGKEGKGVDQAEVRDACRENKGTGLPHHQLFHHLAVDAAIERMVANRQISRVTEEDIELLKLNPSGAARIEAK